MSTLHGFSNRLYTRQLIPQRDERLSTQSDLLQSTTQTPHISRLNQIHCNPHVHSSQFLKSIIYSTTTPSYTQLPTSQHRQIPYYPTLKLSIYLDSIRYIVIHMSTVHSFSNRSYTLQFPLEEIKAFQNNQTYYDPPFMLSNLLTQLYYCNLHDDSSQFLKSIIYPTITSSYTQHPTSQHNQIPTIHLSSTSYLSNLSDSLKSTCPLFTVAQIDHIHNNYSLIQPNPHLSTQSDTFLSKTQAPHISRLNQTQCNPHFDYSRFLKSNVPRQLIPQRDKRLSTQSDLLQSTTQAPHNS